MFDSYAEKLGVGKNDRIMQSISYTDRESLSSKLDALESEDARLTCLLDFAQSKKLLSPNFNLAVAKWRLATLAQAAKLVEAHQIEAVEADLYLWVSKENRSVESIVKKKDLYTTGRLYLEKINASHAEIIHTPEMSAALECTLG